jgi:hypothetical protein
MLQQWIDLALSTGLQVRKTESPELPTTDTTDSPNQAVILCNETEEASIDEIKSE